MISIDEAIAHERQLAKEQRSYIGTTWNKEYSKKCEEYAKEHEQLAEWLEELKSIKEMDLDIPQHFTKEQSDWIKAYCVKRNTEFYNKALDDFVNFASTMPTVEQKDGTIRPMWLKEMSEQLKAGGKKNDL